eukprot:gene10120-12405_t
MKTMLRLIFLAFLGLSAAMKYVQMESALLDMREDYVRRNSADQTQMHEVVFAVKQRNLDQIEKILFEVSDPANPKYGQYLSREEVGRLTENRDSTVKIQQFLLKNGATVVHTTPYGEYITAM